MRAKCGRLHNDEFQCFLFCLQNKACLITVNTKEAQEYARPRKHSENPAALQDGLWEDKITTTANRNVVSLADTVTVPSFSSSADSKFPGLYFLTLPCICTSFSCCSLFHVRGSLVQPCFHSLKENSLLTWLRSLKQSLQLTKKAFPGRTISLTASCFQCQHFFCFWTVITKKKKNPCNHF